MLKIAKINLANHSIRDENVINSQAKWIKNETTAITWIEKKKITRTEENSIVISQTIKRLIAQKKTIIGSIDSVKDVHVKKEKRVATTRKRNEKKTITIGKE